MSIEKVIMFEVRCDVCDLVLDDGHDGETLLWRDRADAVRYLRCSPGSYRPDVDWIGLADGRAFCPDHAKSAPFEQTGPDLFEAVA